MSRKKQTVANEDLSPPSYSPLGLVPTLLDNDKKFEGITRTISVASNVTNQNHEAKVDDTVTMKDARPPLQKKNSVSNFIRKRFMRSKTSQATATSNVDHPPVPLRNARSFDTFVIPNPPVIYVGYGKQVPGATEGYTPGLVSKFGIYYCGRANRVLNHDNLEYASHGAAQGEGIDGDADW